MIVLGLVCCSHPWMSKVCLWVESHSVFLVPSKLKAFKKENIYFDKLESIKPFCGVHTELLNMKVGGMHSYHYAVMG
jgi:hypothetical protein